MKIGWIGTGVMGASMAGHIQAAGHELYVYNRTRDKTEDRLSEGAQWCESPREVADRAEVVFTIVGFPEDVEEVYLGEKGLLSVDGRCRLVVDMTTSRPNLALTLARACASLGIDSLDAPVSGGDIGARNATLAIMVGGKREVFDRALPLLELLGKNIRYMGDHGAGQHTKMCNQILVAGTMIGMCESLLYAVKAGLDMREVIDVVEKGAAASWCISNLGPRVLRGDFEPGFVVEHFVKDMDIALRESAAMGISLPGLALVHQLYLALKAQGHGRSGTQALYCALKKMCEDG